MDEWTSDCCGGDHAHKTAISMAGRRALEQGKVALCFLDSTIESGAMPGAIGDAPYTNGAIKPEEQEKVAAEIIRLDDYSTYLAAVIYSVILLRRSLKCVARTAPPFYCSATQRLSFLESLLAKRDNGVTKGDGGFQ
ncbi:hypothetical protein DdX_07734 [Ditylenchus destructor]|uniref:Uncharacterized protein n=1 Tax=Ditylenchus destructor TaxID=166010 RepID=A0AAD4N3I0_9BILA|nr:hypothetical protein DdX_07734 [Ditylenchus destructor]